MYVQHMLYGLKKGQEKMSKSDPGPGPCFPSSLNPKPSPLQSQPQACDPLAWVLVF